MSGAATAQINARIDPQLKERGDAALAAAGLTPTQAVRALWELAANHAGDPAAIELALFPDRASETDALQEARRQRRMAAAKSGPTIVESALRMAGIPEGAGYVDGLSSTTLKELAYSERYGVEMSWTTE